MTFFNPNEKWKYKKSNIKSKSKNSPFEGFEFIGKVYGIFNNGKIKIDH